MQSVAVIITKLIASKQYFSKRLFVIIWAAMVAEKLKIGNGHWKIFLLKTDSL